MNESINGHSFLQMCDATTPNYRANYSYGHSIKSICHRIPSAIVLSGVYMQTNNTSIIPAVDAF